MKLYKRTYYIFLNELRRLRKKPMPIIAATIAPLIASFVILFIMGNPEIKDLPFIVVDYDNSSLSRMVTRNLDANGSLKLVDVVANEAIAQEKIRNLDGYYTIIIPKGFASQIKSGQGSDVKVIVNGAMLIYSKLGFKAIGQTLATISTGINITRLKAKGLSANEAFDKAVPISVKLHLIGNPYVDYRVYLIPGMILSILQISASFSTLWIFRSSTKGRLLPSYGNLLPFLLGKTLPIWFANLITVIVVFTVIFPMAGIAANAAYFNLFLLTLLYVSVSMGIGFVAAILFKDVVFSGQFLLVINSPVFVFSGYTFPIWAMPKILQDFTYIIPVRHYFDGFFPMFLYGRTTELGIMPLFIIGTVLWGSAVLLLVIHNYFNKKELSKRKGAFAV